MEWGSGASISIPVQFAASQLGDLSRSLKLLPISSGAGGGGWFTKRTPTLPSTQASALSTLAASDALGKGRSPSTDLISYQ